MRGNRSFLVASSARPPGWSYPKGGAQVNIVTRENHPEEAAAGRVPSAVALPLHFTKF